jgi:Ras homolog enriched in brain
MHPLTQTAGKSALTVQYVDGHFVDSYYPTIENTFEKAITYNGERFQTEIVDTAGQVTLPQCASLANLTV